MKKASKKNIVPTNHKQSIILVISIIAIISIFALYLGKVFHIGPLSSLFATPVSINWIGSGNKAIECNILSSQELCSRYARNNSAGNPAVCEWIAPKAAPTEATGRGCKLADCQKGVQGCNFVNKPNFSCTIDSLKSQELCANAGGAWGPTGKSIKICDGTKLNTSQQVTIGYCKNI